MTRKYEIRDYKQEDIPTLVEGIGDYLSGETYAEGNTAFKGLAYDHEKMYKTLNEHLSNVDFFCKLIIADEEIVGGLCAYVATPIFSSDRFAYDQLLYVLPKFKDNTAVIRLIQSYTEWAKSRKVKQCYLRTSTLYKETGFTKLCQRLGFSHYETGFAKEI